VLHECANFLLKQIRDKPPGVHIGSDKLENGGLLQFRTVSTENGKIRMETMLYDGETFSCRNLS
jgi:hypothetical protein